MTETELLVGVALLAPSDRRAHAIAERELAAVGIDCVIEGSVVYSVQVRARDQARAREILSASTDLQGHWIQFSAE
jgi:hypothetical protein